MTVDPSEMQFCVSDGATIAYTDWGGKAPVVLLMNDFSVEAQLLTGLGEPFRTSLSKLGRLAMADLRGCGASDPADFDHPHLQEQRTDDLVAVLDALGTEVAVVVGLGIAGALAALFAARHPDRVDRLVLYGPFAKLVAEDGHEFGMTQDQFDEHLEHLATEWGHGYAFVRQGWPERTGDEGFRRAWARTERMTATPSNYVKMYRSYAQLDLRPLLPNISAPTLVIERREFGIVPASAGRDVASRIPGATYVELEPDRDMSKFDDIRVEMEAFLTGKRPPQDVDRRLVTILITDIVSSTTTAGELGDRVWTQRLDAHDTLSRELISRFGGRQVKSTGDGILATFDSPSRAMRCARTLVDELDGIGIPIRAGMHAGEVEIRGDDVGGVAVHLAERVCSAAEPREVLVSRTVPDLVAGSGLRFVERGDHELKGLPGVWRLFRLDAM
jgi:class 3 adenylate cyclase